VNKNRFRYGGKMRNEGADGMPERYLMTLAFERRFPDNISRK